MSLRVTFHAIFIVIITLVGIVALGYWRVERMWEAHGTAVNLAGAQRMLSQRAALEGLRIASGLGNGDIAPRLQRAVEGFERGLEALRRGVPAAHIPPETDSAILEQLDVLERRWRSFLSVTERLADPRLAPATRQEFARQAVTEADLLLEAAERTVALVQRQGTTRRALVSSALQQRILLVVSVAAAGMAWLLAVRTANQAVGAERRFRELADGVTEGILVSDAAGTVAYTNPAARRIFGYSEAEMKGMPAGRLLPHAALRPGSWQGEAVRASGEPVFLEGSTSSVASRSGNFHTHVVRDVTERRRLEQRLAHLADRDPLTGLFNRRRFTEELERQLALARRYGEAGALVLLDLDAFRDLNNSLGRQAGDAVLAEVAARLRAGLADPEMAARLGGDEFAILLPRADGRRARAAAAELLASLRSHRMEISGHAFQISASAGVALFPEHGLTADQLLDRAEHSVRYAKKRGRDRLEVYGPEVEAEEPPAAFTWEQRLRRALASDELVLVAQPILDLRSRRVTRFELLLRLPDERGELVLPGVFLEAARRAGLLGAIDRWVARQAIRLIADHMRTGRSLCLEVNLSPSALADSEFPEQLTADLAASQIPPGLLVLEITETAALSDIRRARAFMQALRAQGCRFALDDFGVGFTSFLYLKHLPVDCVKIDGTFIQNLHQDPVNARIVKAIVEVARGLEIETVAEFVEDEATVELLRELGVDYAQGFHIGRPGVITEQLRRLDEVSGNRALPPLFTI